MPEKAQTTEFRSEKQGMGRSGEHSESGANGPNNREFTALLENDTTSED